MNRDMVEVLIIGAGHIGAMSDLQSDKVNTYAKYFSKYSTYNVSVFEPDEKKAAIVANNYGYKILSRYSAKILSDFSLVVIASPSNMHFQHLADCIQSGVENVICEKPICTDAVQFQLLQKIISEPSKTNVIINFPRTFLHEFILLKEIVQLRGIKNLLKVQIRYQKGLLNNCSHAFDLVSFILGRMINITDFTKTHSSADHFLDDATISGFGYWDDVLFEISGVPFIKYSILEIDFFFDTFRISVSNCGRSIEIFDIPESGPFTQVAATCIKKMEIDDYSPVTPIFSVINDSDIEIISKKQLERSMNNMKQLLMLQEL